MKANYAMTKAYSSSNIVAPGSTPQLHVTPNVIVSKAPRTGHVLGEVPIATPFQIRNMLDEARIGQSAWQGIGLNRRLVFIRALRDSLYRNRDRVLTALVDEQGKVLEEAQSEYLAVLAMLDYYQRSAKSVLQPVRTPVPLVSNRRFLVERRPYGVVLVIAPWNYPLFLSIGPVAAALVAGNTVVYKPSEYATQVGEVIAAVIAEAGIPLEVFQIAHGFGDVGAALIDARPDRIVFTGSVPTGKKIARAAAEHLIPVTLELGGKDAAIVLDDADLKRAAEGIVWAGMFNAGQTCASVERVIVQQSVAAQLQAAMIQVIEDNLLNPDGEPLPALAALTTPEQIEIVDRQVQQALAGGATAIIGGYRLEHVGRQFYAPTILTDVPSDIEISHSESFGPVIVVNVVEDDEAAVLANNDTTFGLTASVWTQDEARGMRIARQLAVGHASVNSHLLISGVAEVPWGGVKESGYGRTHGPEGLLEMTYTQTLDTETARLPLDPFSYPYNTFKRGLIRRLIDVLYGPAWRDKLRGLFR